MSDRIKYSIQLAILKKLINQELISKFEYDVMKEKIKNRCNIVDEILV